MHVKISSECRGVECKFCVAELKMNRSTALNTIARKVEDSLLQFKVGAVTLKVGAFLSVESSYIVSCQSFDCGIRYLLPSARYAYGHRIEPPHETLTLVPGDPLKNFVIKLSVQIFKVFATF